MGNDLQEYRVVYPDEPVLTTVFVVEPEAYGPQPLHNTGEGMVPHGLVYVKEIDKVRAREELDPAEENGAVFRDVGGAEILPVDRSPTKNNSSPSTEIKPVRAEVRR